MSSASSSILAHPKEMSCKGEGAPQLDEDFYEDDSWRTSTSKVTLSERYPEFKEVWQELQTCLDKILDNISSNPRLRAFVDLTRNVFRAKSPWLPTRAETSRACDEVHLTLLKHVMDAGLYQPGGPPSIIVEHSGLQTQGRLLSDGKTAEIQVAIRLLYYMDGPTGFPFAVDLYSRKSMKKSLAKNCLENPELQQSHEASTKEDDAATLSGSDADMETGKTSSIAGWPIMASSRRSRPPLSSMSGAHTGVSRPDRSIFSALTGCFGHSPTSTATSSDLLSEKSLGSNAR